MAAVTFAEAARRLGHRSRSTLYRLKAEQRLDHYLVEGPSGSQLLELTPPERPTLEAYLDSLPEEELEALAEQRWARLRPDTVTEGDRDAVTQHSCSTRDGFFVVPKFG